MKTSLYHPVKQSFSLIIRPTGIINPVSNYVSKPSCVKHKYTGWPKGINLNEFPIIL